MADEPRDWAAQLTDTVVRVVDTVRDRTTRPVIVLARGLVYGLIVVVGALTALVLLTIALIRALDNFVPGDVWIAYFIAAGIFLLAGMLLMAKRRPPTIA